jgi:PPOX class probable F420-dependent enzyme
MNAIDTLGRHRFVLLETRKRDGSWVGTPVSIAEQDGRLFFRAYDASGKAKRLKNFREVKVTPSNYRGKPAGATVAGVADLIDGPAGERAGALLAAKYPVLQGRLVPWMHKRKGFATLHYELRLENH